MTSSESSMSVKYYNVATQPEELFSLSEEAHMYYVIMLDIIITKDGVTCDKSLPTCSVFTVSILSVC